MDICMSTKTSKNGLYTDYFENGQEKVEKNYRDGRLHGKWTEWYENGQKKKEGNYTDGIQVAYWICLTKVAANKANGLSGTRMVRKR